MVITQLSTLFNNHFCPKAESWYLEVSSQLFQRVLIVGVPFHNAGRGESMRGGVRVRAVDEAQRKQGQHSAAKFSLCSSRLPPA